MPVAVLTDVRGYFGGMDATGQNTSLSLEGSAVDLDATTMGSGGWTVTALGLKSGKLTYAGYANYGAIPGLDQQDDRMWADTVGGLPVPFTLSPSQPNGAGNVGSVAYNGLLMESEYKRLGKVGELDPFELSGVTTGPFTNGFILHPQGTARTATGNGTGVQYPAVTAGKSMYIAFHALSIAGTLPTLTLTVQSATANTFAGPTLRATFTGITTQTGAQLIVVPGPITDTWWRVVYTIGGTASYLFAASAGIV
jgi:hypothetical protein